MTKRTVYAYVIPDDAVVDESLMIQGVNEFISDCQWLCPDVWTVNQRHETGERELGLNIALPELCQEPINWFSGVEAIVALCVDLRHEFECDFVLGVAEDGSHAKDVIEVDDDLPNIQFLKKFIGVEPPSAAVQP